MEVIQIVPYLAPTISGVGDYALLLAQELRRTRDIHTRFIIGDPAFEETAEADGFPVTRVIERTAKHLAMLLREMTGPGTPVLLNYVGYGYQKRGCPFWLVKGVEAWKKTSAHFRFVTMIHELYAFGFPWRSSFWTSPLQRALVKSLAQASDHCVTNQKGSMRALVRMTSIDERKFSVLPVFSNVGETERPFPVDSRSRRMIVFGSANWRRETYFEHRCALEQACYDLGIMEIVDIGAPFGSIPRLSVPCVSTGELPAEQVSQEMNNAMAGFFTYPSKYLGKSGVFAAYAAHGLLAVTHSNNAVVSEDGLRPGEHFLPISRMYASKMERIKSIVQRLHRWYVGHRISEQARLYEELLKSQ